VSLLSSQTVEQQIFHFCLEHPEKIIEIKDNYFLSSEGHDLYETLLELYRGNVSFTDENIVSTGNRVNEGITPALLAAIRAVPYDGKAWDHYRFLAVCCTSYEVQLKLEIFLRKAAKKSSMKLHAASICVKLLKISIELR